MLCGGGYDYKYTHSTKPENILKDTLTTTFVSNLEVKAFKMASGMRKKSK